MKFSIFFLSLFFIYGLIFVLPKKIKIMKKHGWGLSNKEMIKLAKHGDLEALSLLKASRVLMAVAVVGTFVYILEKYFLNLN